jgi:hypothetical protein
MKTLAVSAVLVLGTAILGCGAPPVQTVGQSDNGVTVTYVPGNPSCPAGFFEYKVDPPSSGTYNLPDGINSITITTDGYYVDWSATLGIDIVLVKGGDNANMYTYDPEATSGSGLQSPPNTNTPDPDDPYGLSHVTFCFDYEVMVTKTASAAFKRTWSWDILKAADQQSIKLSTGQTFTMPYTVTVSATGYTDSDWSASGEIKVFNPAPMAATIEGVTDVVDGGYAATVDCGVSFPYSLAAGATLTCSYSVSLPDGTNRNNVAEASTSGDVGPGSGSATVDFGSAAIDGVDDCVDVTDDKYGALGQVCAGDAPKTFGYSMNIGPYAVCGQYTFDNTASFVTNDTGATGSSSASVAIDVPCQIGCTLTPGYWKTHSEYGPAPYDDTWALQPAGADTAFFLSGLSYYGALWTAPKGNAYYILAHAYIAAEMNQLNGADFTEAAQAFADATALLSTYTPAEVDGMRKNNSTYKLFVSLGATLDDYNNGLTGPGHCSE